MFKYDGMAEAMVEHYRHSASLAETARSFGVPFVTARALLRRHGVETRDSRRRVFTAAEIGDVVARWQAGESQTAIAAVLGTSQSSVSHMLIARGFRRGSFARGEHHGQWRGGRSHDRASGYVSVIVPPEHPFYAAMANRDGRVLEHRWVMANALGRSLTHDETVHHLNGSRADNRIENLQLRTGKHGRGVAMVCGDCGSANIISDELGA